MISLMTLYHLKYVLVDKDKSMKINKKIIIIKKLKKLVYQFSYYLGKGFKRGSAFWATSGRNPLLGATQAANENIYRNETKMFLIRSK